MSPAPSVSRWEGGVIDPAEDTRWYWPGKPPMANQHRLVIWTHGRTGNEEQLYTTRLIWDLAAAGYLVAVGDYGGPATWGNDLSISRVQATIDRAVAQGWAANTAPILVGTSMGALVALNWQRQATTKASGVVTLWGAYDLDTFYANSTYTAEIDSAYAGAYDAGVDGPAHNPSVYYADLVGTPIRTFYGESDTVAPPSDEAEFATAFTNAGGDIQRTSLGATAHFDTTAITSDMIIEAVDLVA